MSAQSIEIIKEYDVLFAVRTGVTILLPKTPVLDGGVETPAHFHISPDHARDILVSAAGRSFVLKDMKKDYIDEAITRGTIMFYEMVDDEVVRCTPCTYAR